jgi:hypothetical protein
MRSRIPRIPTRRATESPRVFGGNSLALVLNLDGDNRFDSVSRIVVVLFRERRRTFVHAACITRKIASSVSGDILSEI